MAIDTVQFCYNDGVSSPAEVCQTAQSLTLDDGTIPFIIWAGDEFTSSVEDAFGDANIYFYEGSNGHTEAPYDSSCGYYVDKDTWSFKKVISDLAPDGLGDNVSFTTGEYIVKYQIVTEVTGTPVVHLNYSAGREDQWWDLFRCDIRLDTPAVDNVVDEVLLDVIVAIDNGAGSPVTGSEVTRRVRIHAKKIV